MSLAFSDHLRITNSGTGFLFDQDSSGLNRSNTLLRLEESRRAGRLAANLGLDEMRRGPGIAAMVA